MNLDKLKQDQKLQAYVEAIETKNQVMNLTGFTGERLWNEGIFESLLCLKDVKQGKLLDIGAGAGFPSIPHAIVNPNVAVTIYEPLQKRVNFLTDVKNKLNLSNVELKVLRAEESTESEVYDFATARAVAPLRILIEIAHKVLKVGGLMLFPKGEKYQEEIAAAKKLIKKLDLSIEVISIEDQGIKTFLIKLTKNSPTPQGFPRNWAQIKKG